MVGNGFAARSTRAHVVDALREAIISGELAPGEQLRQDELRAQFGTSTAPIREALRELDAEGLVALHANRGAFVTEISERELRELLLPMRLNLEQYAADRACTNGQDGLCDRLDEVVARMRRGADRGDLREVTEADVLFHRTLMDAADSGQASRLWASIQWCLRLQFNRLGAPASRLPAITDEHSRLVQVLRSGDADARHAALHEHIIADAERLMHETRAEVPTAHHEVAISTPS